MPTEPRNDRTFSPSAQCSNLFRQKCREARRALDVREPTWNYTARPLSPDWRPLLEQDVYDSCTRLPIPEFWERWRVRTMSLLPNGRANRFALRSTQNIRPRRQSDRPLSILPNGHTWHTQAGRFLLDAAGIRDDQVSVPR